MKKLILLVVAVTSVFFISCKQKMSSADKTFIETQITLHNSTFGLQYKTDSISRRERLKDAFKRLDNSEARANSYADSINHEMYKIDSGQVYNPQSDPNLTFEKFMNYCEKNEYQTPVEHAKLLTSTNK